MATSLDTLRRLRKNARDVAEARFSARLAELRQAEEALERAAQRVAAHRNHRAAVATERLHRLAAGSPLGEAAMAARCERRLHSEEQLLRFGRELANRRCHACAAGRDLAAQTLRSAEVRLAVVEQLLARQAEEARQRRLRREEREADDYSSSRNSSL
jgi:flagellar biosynthesis chaperone FliJ